MNQYPRLIASVMLGALLVAWASGAAAQQAANPPTVGARDVTIDAQRLKQLFTAYQRAYSELFFTQTEMDCSSSNCSVAITLTTTTVDNKLFCIARMPELLKFSNTDASPPPKTITWTLSTGILAGRVVEFHEQSGILIVDDGKKQINPDPARTSPTVFEATNKRKLKGTSTYVPVIIFRTADGIPELCAAADPKIVNN